MITRRTHSPRWVRRSRVWWFETPRAEIVRMIALLGFIVVVAAALVLLAVTRG